MGKQIFRSEIVEWLNELESCRQAIFQVQDKILKDDWLALIVICSGIDMALTFLVKVLCKRGSMIVNGRIRIPLLRRLLVLHEIGVIDDRLFDNVKETIKLRNKVAHELKKTIDWEGKFSFDKADSVYTEYVQKRREPEELADYLIIVWGQVIVAGRDALAKRHFDKMKIATRKMKRN